MGRTGADRREPERGRGREEARPEEEKAKVEGNHGAQRLASSTPHRDVFLSLSVSFALLLVCFYSYPKGVGIETRAHALNLHSVQL